MGVQDWYGQQLTFVSHWSVVRDMNILMTPSSSGGPVVSTQSTMKAASKMTNRKCKNGLVKIFNFMLCMCRKHAQYFWQNTFFVTIQFAHLTFLLLTIKLLLCCYSACSLCVLLSVAAIWARPHRGGSQQTESWRRLWRRKRRRVSWWIHLFEVTLHYSPRHDWKCLDKFTQH